MPPKLDDSDLARLADSIEERLSTGKTRAYRPDDPCEHQEREACATWKRDIERRIAGLEGAQVESDKTVTRIEVALASLTGKIIGAVAASGAFSGVIAALVQYLMKEH